MKYIVDKLSSIIFLIFKFLYLHLTKQVAKNTFQVAKDIKVQIRPESTDAFIAFEIFNLDEYNEKSIGLEDTVVDIGAHIGCFSLLAAKKSLKGKVIAYEPSPENYNILLKHKKLNRLKNLYIHNKAVSSKNGKLNLFLPPNNHGGNSFFADSPKSTTVNTISLTQVFQDNRLNKIDFLKIDAEGAEYEILMTTPKKYFEKIEKIALEYHDYFPTNHNVKELKKFLEENSFKVKIINLPPILARLYKTGLLKAKKDKLIY